jgi:hypothetical protein
LTKQKAETKEQEENIEEQVKEDCNDAEKALTTRDACDYTAKEKIKKAAKRLEDKYLKAGREDKIGTISTEIRKYFDNPNHKDYVSHILGRIGNGKYVRDWTRRDYQKEIARNLKEIGDIFYDIGIAITEERFANDFSEEKLEKYILGQHAFLKLLEPIIDKRWAYDWLEWTNIIENYYRYGSSYASKKSEIEVPDLINKRTGRPERRRITRDR